MLVSSEGSAITPFPKVTILYSPIVEMAASLHALCDAAGHPSHAQWIDNTLAKMDEGMRAEMTALSDITERWTLVMDLVCHIEQHEIGSATDFLTHLKELDHADFAYGLLSGLVPRGTIEGLIQSPNALDAWDGGRTARFFDLSLIKHILSNVNEIHNRLVVFLSQYWVEIYAREWQQIGTLEINQVAAERTLLQATGSERYLTSAHRDLEITNGAITVIGMPERTYPLSDIRNIDVFVSAYVSPHLMLNCMEGRFTLYKGIELVDTHREFVADEIFAFLRAIGSETKLSILRELYEKPKTTKELSEALGIAPSSVSEHLKIMRDAELVYPQRVKNAVYNRFLYENYQALASYLGSFFEQ